MACINTVGTVFSARWKFVSRVLTNFAPFSDERRSVRENAVNFEPWFLGRGSSCSLMRSRESRRRVGRNGEEWLER
jgi:hypothetical protein